MFPHDFWLIKSANCLNSLAQSIYDWTGTSLMTTTRENGIAPLGRSTTCNDSTSNGAHYVDQLVEITGISSAAVLENTDFTIEAFIQPLESTYVYLETKTLVGAIIRVIFNTVTQEIHSETNPNSTHAWIVTFGEDDWLHIGLTIPGAAAGMKATHGTGLSIRIGVCDDSATVTYPGTSREAVRIWKGIYHQGDARYPFYQDDYSNSSGVVVTNPTEAVKFFPEWSSDDSAGKIQTTHGTTQGRKTVYKSGEYKFFRFDVRLMSLQEALMVNRWWKDKDELVYLDGLTHKTYSCILTGSRQPMGRVNDTYLNQISGIFELEILNEIFPY